MKVMMSKCKKGLVDDGDVYDEGRGGSTERVMMKMVMKGQRELEGGGGGHDDCFCVMWLKVLCGCYHGSERVLGGLGCFLACGIVTRLPRHLRSRNPSSLFTSHLSQWERLAKEHLVLDVLALAFRWQHSSIACPDNAEFIALQLLPIAD
ncbi:hypothetical protein VNO77_09376 [Canavalia gladiata]|uniref:Uncharacterized protein n=1 Tax=Canavalia gladiata TaxID=3824 RepID=A0AAN9QU65_CANGL